MLRTTDDDDDGHTLNLSYYLIVLYKFVYWDSWVYPKGWGSRVYPTLEIDSKVILMGHEIVKLL